jgi:peptidoglycan/LPS O-acetylase OafA/YrhL
MLVFAVMASLGSVFLFAQGGVAGANRMYVAAALVVLIAYAAYRFLFYPRIAARARLYAQGAAAPKVGGAAEQGVKADNA